MTVPGGETRTRRLKEKLGTRLKRAPARSGGPRTVPLLLEVGCEEIPARFLPDAEKGLGERVEEALREARLLPDADAGELREAPLRTYSTPRRLVLYVASLLAQQPDKVEEILGPPVKVAVDAEGKYTRAAESFATRNSARLEDLTRAATPKGEYLALRKTIHGRSAREVLPEILPAAILGLSFPKSMYWTAKAGPRFVRPIRWVLAIIGAGKHAETVEFEMAGVKSGNFTFGHRAKGGEPLRVSDLKDYMKKLGQSHVEVDPARRMERVKRETQALLEKRAFAPVRDEWLAGWIVNSTEWPRPVLGSFDERFLGLPREVLVTVMRNHQKYFAVEDARGNLRPHFVAVLNMDADAKGLIRQGHERVLTARFRDAEFFWTADQRVPLRERYERGMLDRVTYHAKLGTYGDKVRRMEAAAQAICRTLEGQGKLAGAETAHALRAVQLSKCDLTTQLVQEFPELQGIVGGLYARAQGEPREVADAIYDHYLPQGAGDECPRSAVGGVVSLADKLDSVTAGFAAGLEPSGSSDPFALRRAGNGIIRLAVEALPGLDLTVLTEQIFNAEAASTGVDAVLAGGELSRKVDAFLRERLEFYFREGQGLRYDTVRAVLGSTEILHNLVPSAALSRARALERVRDTEDFRALAAAAKRTRNIRKSANEADIVSGRANPDLFAEEAERELFEAYQSLGRRIEELSDRGEFEGAFRLMATIRPQVDRFFDKVLVMTEDAEQRRNRLKLLLRLNEDVFTSLADIAEITLEPRAGAAGQEAKT